MIESPLIDELIQEVLAEKKQAWIETILKKRFGFVPADLMNMLKKVQDEVTLDALMEWAVCCPDLEAFRVRLATT